MPRQTKVERLPGGSPLPGSIHDNDRPEPGGVPTHGQQTPLFRWLEGLQKHYDECTRTSSVSCSTPDCPCRGHVSAEHVEIAMAESRLKRAEAERAQGTRGSVTWVPRLLRPTEAASLAEPGF